jgi:ribonuclease P protein component
LTHDREFQAVFDARIRHGKHPIVVHARPNDLGHCRLGLSVSRKVNAAVRRNRIKRLLREAFRLIQQELPGPYDLVVAVRAHQPRDLSWYQQALRECMESVHRQWINQPSNAARNRSIQGDQADSPRES